MSWGMVAVAAAGVIGGAVSAKAGEKGADAQQQASMYATQENARQYDQTRNDLMPWLNAGTNALGQQQAFLNGDWSGFQNSPDYAFAYDQGMRGLDRAQAANLSLGSGGADADRIALGQGLATQYAGNYYNRLAGLSQTGQVTGNQLGQFGANMAQQNGQNAMNGANARASAYANSANAWGNALNTVAGAYGQYRGGG